MTPVSKGWVTPWTTHLPTKHRQCRQCLHQLINKPLAKLISLSLLWYTHATLIRRTSCPPSLVRGISNVVNTETIIPYLAGEVWVNLTSSKAICTAVILRDIPRTKKQICEGWNPPNIIESDSCNHWFHFKCDYVMYIIVFCFRIVSCYKTCEIEQ